MAPGESGDPGCFVRARVVEDRGPVVAGPDVADFAMAQAVRAAVARCCTLAGVVSTPVGLTTGSSSDASCANLHKPLPRKRAEAANCLDHPQARRGCTRTGSSGMPRRKNDGRYRTAAGSTT